MNRLILVLLLSGPVAALAGCGQTPAPGPSSPALPSALVAPPPVLPPVVPPPRDDGRLPPDVRPTAYALDLVVDPSKTTFTGTARIAIVVDQPTRTLVMHGRALTVVSAVVTAAGRSQPARAQSRTAAHGRGQPEELVLTVDAPVPAGPAAVQIDYQAPFSDGLHGLYRAREGGADYAFTQFEPNDARRAFPCFDEPGNKTPVTLTLTVPDGLQAFANTPLSGQRVVAGPEGTSRVFTFEPSPPVPTYLVAFAVGPLDARPGPTTAPPPLRLLAAQGKTALGQLSLDAAAAQVALLGQYFDRPYPYSKLDLVAVPNFGAGAMENPGLITFREELLLMDPAHVSVDGRRAMASVMAHELAHQWFGDLVTMKWWDDLWLNEAFASWMSDKIVDQWRPETRARLQAVGRKARVMAEDSLGSARRIRNPVRSSSEASEAFDGITYDKGRAVLNMLETWLGEDAFRDGLRGYIKTHAWSNATAGDLYASLAAASGGRDVAGVMDTFTGQTGVPLVSASLTCTGDGHGRGVVHLRQQEYQTLDRRGPSDKVWQIPLCVTYPAGRSRARACTVLTGAEADLPLPPGPGGCPSFVYANADEAGYYRLHLTAADLKRLVGKTSAPLSEQERFGVVNNAWAAVAAGELPAGAFLELLQGFRNEPSRLVWGQITEALGALDRAVITDGARPAFARMVRALLEPMAGRLGWTPKPGEPDDRKLLRELIVGTLGDLGDDPATQRQAKAVVQRWLAEPAGTDADLARIALPLGAKHGDAALFDQLRAVLRDPRTPEQRVRALGGLAAFEDPALISRTLGLIVDGTIKAQDLRYVLGPLGTRRATREATYAWIQGHYDALAAALPLFARTRLMSLAGSACDGAEVQAVVGFLRPRLEGLEGVEKNIRQSIEEGLRCAALRDKESAPTTRWLAARR